MIILAINTAFSDQVGLVLHDNDEILGNIQYKFNQSHCEELISSLNQLLQQSKIAIKEIGLISCLKGPGSFTSLRIGIAFAKTLAQQLKISLQGISTLECLAFPYYFLNSLIISIIPACRGEVNFAVFAPKNNSLNRLVDDISISEAKLIKKLSKVKGNLYLITQNLPNFFSQIKEKNLGTEITSISPPKNLLATSAALLGYQKAINKENQGFEITPHYSHGPVLTKPLKTLKFNNLC
jgi:tRNA threonylcarbamoyladenosine biosynthesis protein TsaB